MCRTVSTSAMVLVTLLSMVCQDATLAQSALGTSFTYQGMLALDGTQADGEFDFEFRLFDAATGGNQQGSVVVLEDLIVSGGLFSVELDFGAEVFGGEPPWLEIGIRPGAVTGDFSPLQPRQRLTPTPFALHAASAETAAEAASTADADLLDGMDSTEFAATSHGHAAAEVTSGVLADARIPATIARTGDIMTTVLANDGTGSGLDADTLDGTDSTGFATDTELTNGLAGKAELAHGHILQDLSGAVTDTQVPDNITVNLAGTAADAQLLDGLDSSEFATDSDLTTGLAGKTELLHGHNLQDLGGAVTDAQVPDTITVLNADMATTAATSENADALDGMDSTAFATSGHGHNLQSLSGTVTDTQVPDDITVNLAAMADDADFLDGLDSTDFTTDTDLANALSGTADAAHSHDLQSLGGLVTDAQVPDNIRIVDAENALKLGGAPRTSFVEKGSAAIGTTGSNGSDNVVLWSFNETPNHGLVVVRDPSSITRSLMWIDSRNSGALGVFGPNGNFNVSISATADTANHGSVDVVDSFGSIRARMYVDQSGNGVSIANVKLFVEEHPNIRDAHIAYVSLEGPEAGMYHRGKVQLEAGTATIVLPEHFAALASPDSLTVQLTPRSIDSKGLAVKEISADTIEIGELFSGTGSYEVHYIIHAVRKGYEDHKPVISDQEFKATFARKLPDLKDLEAPSNRLPSTP